MPPAPHPRSRQTVSLFTGTLLVSFLIVGLPHVLPCPVNPRALADSSDDSLGQRRRRRRRVCAPDDQMAARQVASGEAAAGGCNSEDAETGFEEGPGRRRECPVPKPGGLVGQILGFEEQEKPREVIVESVRARRTGRSQEEPGA